ncbi:MAG: molybdenum cofactor guanylyltransferase [Deferribacteres bacterium]|nr:molybdenum cofactor guanylyltransferase [Deferribacteres bacterium]
MRYKTTAPGESPSPRLTEECSCAILAGGENRRMPVLKAFIRIRGQRIIDRNLRLMKRLFSEVFIVTHRPELYLYPGVTLLADIYDTRGPIAGVFTALLNASNPWVFISACDMPFINGAVIEYMASKRDGYDAVVPKSSRARGSAEPLFAFYSRRLLPSMEKALLAGKKGLKDFLSNKRVQYISRAEIKGIDPEGVSFINLNTPEDVEIYLRPGDKP